MENRIETLEPTLILGKSLEMSLSNDRTMELWKSFGPLVKTIKNRKNRSLISMQRFDQPFDPSNLDPEASFTKWAGAEVSDQKPGVPVENHSPDLALYEIKGGLYAVFKHVGPASEFGRSLGFIYGSWFPSSGYELDHREHFEILPEGYQPHDSEAEEEIWIPIRKKSGV